MAEDGDILSFDDVTVHGKRGEIVDGVTFGLAPGAFGVLCGPTGGGKTTVLRLAHFDRRPDSGTVRVIGFSSGEMTGGRLPEARRHIGYIFQDYKLLPDRTAGDNVALALEIAGTGTRHIRRRTLELLGQVGLAAKRHMQPLLMSGGEQQRLGIARAIAFDPEVLLADEPTGNLDRDTAREIMDLIRRINHRGTTVLLATHDLDLVRGYGYPCWEVDQGKVCAVGPL